MWHGWNIFWSILVMGSIGAIVIPLALLFGGNLVKGYSNDTALFVLVGVLVGAMVAAAAILAVLT